VKVSGDTAERGARSSVAAIALGTLLILTAFGSAWAPDGAPRWGIWCMIAGAALVMAATMALGALRSSVPGGRVTLIAGFILVVIAAGFGAPMLLPAETVGGSMVLGLPLRVAIEVFGVGVLPALILPLCFALAFRADGLDDRSLAELRRRGAELRSGGESGPEIR
jgi:hypothetical protein